MEKAVVIAQEGSRLQVQLPRTSACGRCGLCISQGNQTMVLWVENDCRAVIGDAVWLDLSGRRLLAASALAYLLPLCLMILFAFIGYTAAQAWRPEWKNMLSVIGFLSGLGIGILVMLWLGRRRRPGFEPRAAAIDDSKA